MAFKQYTPEEWMLEIEAGLEFRRKFGLEQVWGELEAIFYNVHKSMANDGPNVFASTGDSLLSSLTMPRPTFSVKPDTMEAVDTAPVVENMDQKFVQTLGMQDEAETATIHAFLHGVGIWKIGYDSEYGYDPSLDVGGALNLGFTLTQVSKNAKRRIEHDSGVTPGMPWLKSVPPHDIVVPWGVKTLDNSPWIAHRFVRQIDDLRNDDKYSNTRHLQPTMSMEDFVNSYTSTVRTWTPHKSFVGRSFAKYSMVDRASRESQYVELFEIHDKRTGEIMVIAPGHDKFLRKDINALQINNRLPFCSLSFVPKSRAFWTTPDAYYLFAQQMELSDLAVQRTKMRRLAVVKFLCDRGMIAETEAEKLLSADVGALAFVEPGADIEKAVKILSTPADQSLVFEEEHIRRNVREQVGFSRNQMGEFTGGRRTATEAQIVDSAAGMRMSRKGKAIKKLYQDGIQLVNGIAFKHWKTPRYIQILGEDMAERWVQASGPDLDAQYSYTVTFTDEAELRQRRMEALETYQLMTQNPSVDPVALVKYLSDQLNDPGFERIFSADIQDAVRAVRLRDELVGLQGNGGGGGQRQAPGLPDLSGGNGQGSLGGFSNGTTLAQGGSPS